jgi:hypothetical protein
MATVDYGTDVFCVTDLDPSFRLVSGQQTTGQAVARRLITERGTLLDDPNYGTDLRKYLGEPKSASVLARCSSDAEREALQDERVESAAAESTYVGDDLKVSVELTTAEGAFELVLGINAVSATLLTVGA